SGIRVVSNTRTRADGGDFQLRNRHWRIHRGTAGGLDRDSFWLALHLRGRGDVEPDVGDLLAADLSCAARTSPYFQERTGVDPRKSTRDGNRGKDFHPEDFADEGSLGLHSGAGVDGSDFLFHH